MREQDTKRGENGDDGLDKIEAGILQGLLESTVEAVILV
jgi:hypothetical protein